MLNLVKNCSIDIKSLFLQAMIKIKYCLLLFCLIGCLAACKKNEVPEPYDPLPQFKADTTAIRAFVKLNNIPVTKDEFSGVYYQILTPGTGTSQYSSATKVVVDYTGKLLDGTTFDSSKGTPVPLTLGNLILGWQFAIPKIQKGGQIRFFVPSYYGYGVRGGGPIPANAILDFNVLLTDVQTN